MAGEKTPSERPSPPPNSLFRVVLREPLVHFLLAGGALFLVHARLDRPPPERIVVSSAFVLALREEQRAQTGKLPSDDETRGLVERYLDEEVLYREALSQGLDRGDLIVRRRLLQKMELVTRASVKEPSEADLQAYLTLHADRYRAAETISFRHVFVSRDRHGDGALARAKELLAALESSPAAGSTGAPPALSEPEKQGDPFVAGASFARRSRADLTTTFGPSFVEGAFAAPLDAWSEPIPSSYGYHLIRATAREGGGAPDLAAVRGRVKDDLLKERQASAVRDQIDRLRTKYAIEVEPRAAP